MTTFLTRYIDFVYYYIKQFLTFSLRSLYSPEFYQEIYTRFTGWGIRFILTASFIGTLIAVIPFFNLLVEVKDYFVYDKLTKNLEGLDHIINQFPTINYNGQSISIDEEEPYFLYNSQDQAYAVIDARNKKESKYKDEKVILTKDQLILNLNFVAQEKKTLIPIEYNKIIRESGSYTIADIKKVLGQISESTIKIFTYLAFPILILLNFIFVILRKLMNVLIIYIFLNMFVNKSLMKDAFRLVMFASSPAVIITQIAYFVPMMKNVAPLIEIWSLVLIIYALHKLKA